MNSAATTAAVKTFGEARPPRFVKYSVTSESEPVEAVTRVPRKSSVAHAEGTLIEMAPPLHG